MSDKHGLQAVVGLTALDMVVYDNAASSSFRTALEQGLQGLAAQYPLGIVSDESEIVRVLRQGGDKSHGSDKYFTGVEQARYIINDILRISFYCIKKKIND